jgi:hypothetical protein
MYCTPGIGEADPLPNSIPILCGAAWAGARESINAICVNCYCRQIRLNDLDRPAGWQTQNALNPTDQRRFVLIGKSFQDRVEHGDLQAKSGQRLHQMLAAAR